MNSVYIVFASVFVSEILWFELTKGRNEKEIGETGKRQTRNYDIVSWYGIEFIQIFIDKREIFIG